MSKKEKRLKHKKDRVKFPIGLKLITIFSFLVLLAMGVTVAVISVFFSNDESISAKATNFTINERMADSVQTKVQSIVGNTQTFTDYLTILKNDVYYELESQILSENYFRSNPEVALVYSGSYGFILQEDFQHKNPTAEKICSEYLDKNKSILESSKNGGFLVKNVSEQFGSSDLWALFFSNRSEFVYVLMDVENIKEACFSSKDITFVFSKNGEALISLDSDLFVDNPGVPNHEIAREIVTAKDSSEYLYIDSSDNKWIYSKSQILNNSISLVTITSESEILKSIRIMLYRVIAITLAVFFLSILVIRHFSKTITNPIGELVTATRQIDEGDYEVELTPRTRDEVGFLTKSFMKMTGGLAERQRLMSTFTKFVNKSIAEKAASGELSSEGEDKFATVFFSDIRSFTAMSEKLTAPEVVSFLNTYFALMVNCVEKTNGIVDKFIGDAVMAVWGAATTCGSPEADAWAAVKAALMMRIALYHFNESRIKAGKDPIKIGCGINTGPIVAGLIGPDDVVHPVTGEVIKPGHQNYTVIGDHVNLASRTEALNKPFATDILITENTYKLIKDKVIVEEMPSVHVKGKEDALRMYAVINAKGVKGPSDIHKLREFLGWNEPDLSKVNTDEEEKKYKIGK